MLKTIPFCAAIIAAMCTSSLAETMKLGDLTISHPTLRATVPGAKVGAGYASITNNGSMSDRLIGGDAKFAARVEIHEMKMENQVMKMKPLANGLEIPAGATVKLMPGGNHLMFMRLNSALKEGDDHKVTLWFEQAGRQEFSFKVKSIAETMKMKHSH